MTSKLRDRRLAGLLSGALAMCGTAPAAADGLEGGIEVGWRQVSVGGDRPKYRQQVNLDDGMRLFDLGLSWSAAPDDTPAGLAPDRVALQLSDLGGDPYERMSLSARRADRYRFRWRRDESEYFYEDVLVLPENASVEGSTGGDFRHYDFRRVRDALSLTLDVSARATFGVDVDRYRKRGDGGTVLDVEREEFELVAPVDEDREDVAVAFGYAWDAAAVTLTERWIDYDQAGSAFLAGASEGSDSDAPTRLTSFFLDQPYSLNGREHRLDGRARPSDRLRLDATIVAADVDVRLEAEERLQGTDFAGAPLDRTIQGTGDLDQDRRLYEFGAEYRVTDRIGLFGKLRRVELDQSGASSFEGDASADWRIDSDRLEAGLTLLPRARLRISAGWSGEWREVASRADGTRVDDVDTDSDGYFLRASYRPVRGLDLYAAWEADSLDDPFTLASPTDTSRLRLRGRYRGPGGLTVSIGHHRVERKNADSGWRSDREQTDLRVGYTTERLSLSGGWSAVDLNRDVDALVLGGTVSALFAIDYGADADFADLQARYRFSPRLTAGVAVRRYDSDGSFAVTRDDVRASLRGRIGPGYRWRLSYRRIDFDEDAIESFDADLVEVSVGIHW